MIKICTQCHVGKDEADFYMNGAKRHSWCKGCFCRTSRADRKKKIVLVRRYDQERSWARRGILTEAGQPFLLADFDRLYQLQQGRCKICGKHSAEFQRTLAVDHDHETGVLRGLLCLNCNRGLGSFQDNPELLRAADRYLNQ